MTREDYYKIKAEKILECIPVHSRSILAFVSQRTSCIYVERTTIILFICELHRHCWQPDVIAAHLSLKGLFSDEVKTDELLENLVNPVYSIFITCQLPIDHYWNITSAFYDFLQYQLSVLLKSGLTADQLELELRSKWTFKTEETISAVISDAEMLSNFPTDLPPLCPSDNSLSTVIDELVNHSEVREIIRQRLLKLPTDLLNRPDLLQLAEFLHTVQVLQRSVRYVFDEILVHEILPILEDAKSSIGNILKQLPSKELELFAPVEEGINLINQILDDTPTLPSGNKQNEASTLPRYVGGSLLLPIWIEDYVLGSGGRFGHNSVGPVPYLFAVIDPPTSPKDISRIGIASLIINNDRLLLPVHIFDTLDDPMVADFDFHLESTTHLHTLMLIASTKSFRFDLFSVDEIESLKLLSSMLIYLKKDILNEIRSIVVGRLLEDYNNDPALFKELFISEISYPK